jgi:hypothetical protein
MSDSDIKVETTLESWGLTDALAVSTAMVDILSALAYSLLISSL